MDVKLETTNWHRISAAEMFKIRERRGAGMDGPPHAGTLPENERKMIFLLPDGQPSYPRVGSDDEESTDSSSRESHK